MLSTETLLPKGTKLTEPQKHLLCDDCAKTLDLSTDSILTCRLVDLHQDKDEEKRMLAMDFQSADLNAALSKHPDVDDAIVACTKTHGINILLKWITVHVEAARNVNH